MGMAIKIYAVRDKDTDHGSRFRNIAKYEVSTINNHILIEFDNWGTIMIDADEAEDITTGLADVFSHTTGRDDTPRQLKIWHNNDIETNGLELGELKIGADDDQDDYQ